ncbi:MAG: tRNA (adenosine(37)-N6)-dimethylallyltransferase MiaA [Methylophilaceae bacterium]|jgi:tRNA dimethylallyltransferase
MKQVFLMGPTASGKTKLAMQLCDEFPVSLISVDATQIYKDCNIGAAKLPQQELERYPHALVDIISPTESFSVDAFINQYQSNLNSIENQGTIPLLVGGSMMYFNAIFNPLDKIPKTTPEIREEVEALIRKNGLDWLYEQVKKNDPGIKFATSDKQRIQRAYEVFLISGKPLTSFYSGGEKYNENDLNFLKIALIPEDRKKLHQSIYQRTQDMLDQGLVDEVESLIKKYPNLSWESNSMRSIGYRQVGMYLRGEIRFDELFDKILFATRQLAKRQITWLRSMQNLLVLDPFEKDISDQLNQSLKNFLKT